MKRVVVVGTQWGDEGKGKITDYLAGDADVVARFQGGNNAGHTIVFGGQKYSVHLIPSGVFNPNTKNILGNGMVINLQAFKDEVEMLQNRGIKDFKLYVSDRSHVIMPYHIALDGAFEELKGSSKIGTTKKGIGPCYADKADRIGIRMCDLLDEELLTQKIKDNVKLKNIFANALGLEPFNADNIISEILELAKTVKPFITDTSIILQEAIDNDEKVVFEGAQGVMLCTDHGTYPMVTSSSPTAASVALNLGIAPKYVDTILGITKAYTTRVGEGVFPTEFENEIAVGIRDRGNEYGTTTGRPRRIGWLDTVVLKHGRRVSGINYLSIMLLDVLSGIDELKICTSYTLNGKEITHIPASLKDYEKCIPNYISLPGFKEDITSVKTFDELPKNAQNYLNKIEEVTGIKIKMFSVGPDRSQTIVL